MNFIISYSKNIKESCKLLLYINSFHFHLLTIVVMKESLNTFSDSLFLCVLYFYFIYNFIVVVVLSATTPVIQTSIV